MKNLIWCKTCVLPSSRPNLSFDRDGVCNACKTKKQKKYLNKNLNELKKIIKRVKKKSNNYDCIIPVSGGKDSTWQVYKCLSFDLKPLAVTWRPHSRTNVGVSNLENLINLGVDHIDLTINPKIEKKILLETFRKKGSTAISMHLGIFNIPLIFAKKLKIPLIIWGENSALEYGYKKKKHTISDLNNSWLKNYGVTNNINYKDLLSYGLKRQDIYFYTSPKSNYKVKQIFLGNYLKWDPLKVSVFAEKKGFKRIKKPKTGIYNFSDIDDDFISIHHWLKYYKFGFTRLFDNLSLEIRNKRITRMEAIKKIKKASFSPPLNDIKKFCKYVNISVKEFFKISEKFRNKDIWVKKNNKWKIRNFIF